MAVSKFSITNRKVFKIQKEPAMEIILNLCEKFDIDVDAIEDRRERKQKESMLNALLDYVMRGFVEIHKDFSITQHLQEPPGEVIKIDYKRVTGEQKKAIDGKDENDRLGMVYALLGAASGLGESAICKLSATDLKVAEALTVAFL